MIKYRIFRFIFIGFLGIAGVAGVTSWQLVFKKQYSSKEPLELTVSYLAEKCSEGGGQMKLESGSVISGGDTNLDDCEITIAPNASVALKDLTLNSGNLILRAEGEDTHVTLHNVIMRGEQAGLHVDIHGANSTVEVVRSSFQYGKSIGFLVGQENDRSSKITIEGSTFEVLDGDTEGIVVVSTASASVQRSMFSSANESAPTMLLARDCQASENQGINTQCEAN